MLWEEFQAAQAEVQKKIDDPDSMVCPKCGSNFFVVEEYKQYRIDQRVGLCQPPPFHPKSPTFYFYKCICGEIYEPQVSYSPGDVLGKIYYKFIEVVKKVLSSDKDKK